MEHPRIPQDDSNPSTGSQSSVPPVPPSFEEFETFMHRAQIEDCELVPWGSNYTFAMLLSDPVEDHPEALAIYKPVAGEIPLWDFPSDSLYRREYASYLVSKQLGWHFIPPTIIRAGPHGTGSVP